MVCSGCGVCSGTLGNPGSDQDAPELGKHVLEGGFGLGGIPGLGVAAGGGAGAVVAVPGVPDDDQGGSEQGERDGALDGAAGAVAGLAGAQDVAGVGEGLLDAPPGGVPGHQGGRAGVQVGGDQGQVIAAGGALVADQDQARLAGVPGPVPQAGDLGEGDTPPPLQVP